MLVVSIFALTLLAGVLMSSLAARSVLSVAVLFLLVGFAVRAFGLLTIAPTNPVIGRFAELALFSILFTDGMRVNAHMIRQTWRLPGRALLIGLPLTLVLTASLAHWVAGVSWPESWLLGAALSPTDPVFAAALIGSESVPERLRRLLNVESGLNDGLALPIVVGLLAVRGASATPLVDAVLEAGLGAVAGVAIAWTASRLERLPLLGTTRFYAPIGVFAVGLLVLGVTSIVHGNEFLAAFGAGITLATCAPGARAAFGPLGEPLSEILKLAALLLFGALITPDLLRDLPASAYAFAALVLVVSRPAAMFVSLVGTRLTRSETAAAAWFGPKGFASVFFGILILKSGLPGAERVFALLALAIALSVIAHSSTDVLVARWFEHEGRSAQHP